MYGIGVTSSSMIFTPKFFKKVVLFKLDKGHTNIHRQQGDPMGILFSLMNGK
jgi:hypothetical protein